MLSFSVCRSITSRAAAAVAASAQPSATKAAATLAAAAKHQLCQGFSSQTRYFGLFGCYKPSTPTAGGAPVTAGAPAPALAGRGNESLNSISNASRPIEENEPRLFSNSTASSGQSNSNSNSSKKGGLFSLFRSATENPGTTAENAKAKVAAATRDAASKTAAAAEGVRTKALQSALGAADKVANVKAEAENIGTGLFSYFRSHTLNNATKPAATAAAASGAVAAEKITKALPIESSRNNNNNNSKSSLKTRPKIPLFQRLKFFTYGMLVAATASLLLIQQQVDDSSKAAVLAATDAAMRISMLENKLNRLLQQQQS